MRPVPRASYHLFEDPDVVARFRHNPQGFLDGVRLPAIFDEIQNAPEAFNFVRSRIDRAPRRAGQWFLTGSQEAGVMRNVTESMAGRVAILQLARPVRMSVVYRRSRRVDDSRALAPGCRRFPGSRSASPERRAQAASVPLAP